MLAFILDVMAYMRISARGLLTFQPRILRGLGPAVVVTPSAGEL